MYTASDYNTIMLRPDEIYISVNAPRKKFERNELKILAESIAKNGMIQPLPIIKNRDGFYELIAGHRRLKAAIMLGMRKVPCVLQKADEISVPFLSIVENLQRCKLDIFEEAGAIERLMLGFGLSQAETALRLGISQEQLIQKLSLLKIPADLRRKISLLGMNELQARAFVKMNSDKREEILENILKEYYTHNLSENFKGEEKEDSNSYKEVEKPVRKTAIGDIRLFSNSLLKLVDTIKSAGVNAQYKKTENNKYIEYKIRIKKDIKEDYEATQLKIC